MFKSLNGGQIPQRATKYSAGFDVFANEDILIGAGKTKLIGLGIGLDENDMVLYDIHPYYYNLELHPRSSLRAKGLGGGVGIIDMDYRDEIKMVITNHNDTYREIFKGDKIGQLILKRHEGWLLPAEYTKDEERNGGFGSTDK